MKILALRHPEKLSTDWHIGDTAPVPDMNPMPDINAVPNKITHIVNDKGAIYEMEGKLPKYRGLVCKAYVWPKLDMHRKKSSRNIQDENTDTSIE